MESQLDATELACLKRLAELYQAGKFANGWPYQSDSETSLNLPPEKWATVLGMMEEWCAIERVLHGDAVPFFSFQVSASAVRLVREIQAKEQEKKAPRDIV